MREELTNHDQDAAIARLAANQHGVVAIHQLERFGVHRQTLTRRVKAQRLHRIHRRVYAIGHSGLSEKGRWMAAVLACGPAAVLSHTSAAVLWGILRGARGTEPAPSGLVHVTVPGSQ